LIVETGDIQLEFIVDLLLLFFYIFFFLLLHIRIYQNYSSQSAPIYWRIK